MNEYDSNRIAGLAKEAGYLNTDNFNDIDGLASLIDACDCVVSVSNTTVHIAGAIGKETYLMLPQGKGRLLYWSKEDEQSIWYKSIKIIEQTKIGQWDNVIQKIKKSIVLNYHVN